MFLRANAGASQAKPLIVKNAAFCSEIAAFGKYTRVAAPFAPGTTVLVYCELENFQTLRISEGMETHLAPEIEIAPKSGGAPTTIPFEPIVDRWPTRRSEFYCHFEFSIPATARPGEYVVRLRITDLHGNTSGQATLPLAVQSPKQGG